MGILKKIKEVFTKEYRQETEYRELLKKNIDKIKLKSEEHVDFAKKLNYLKDNDFQSNFHVKTDLDFSINQGNKNIGREPGE